MSDRSPGGSLALAATAGVLIAAMAVMGWWQYTAYDDQQRNDARTALSRPPVALDEVLGPDESFPAAASSRPVEVRGSYNEAEQFYVEALAGSPHTYAVATPFETQSGSAVIVIRGASEQPTAPAPGGKVWLQGVLNPSASAGQPLDEDRITDGVRIPALLSEVSADLYAGYVVLTASLPAEPLDRVEPPLPNPSRWAGIRNLLYAVQWWV
ncbi:MAG: hypothetical protein H0V49_03930, partial [Nocardioidaceae bacterium]|nr:hypothetical protein [Nocardioidaceae bacterium]